MAKSIIAFVMFQLLLVGKVMACDACGCSVNGVGVGLMATYRQNYIGFQYQYSPFSSMLEHAQGTKDYFHAFELTLRFRIFNRINLQLNQPYRLNIRKKTDGNGTRSGLGDTRLIATYILLNQVAIGKNFKLYAEAGGGVKAPTGDFDPELHTVQNLPENFNPGNGSWAGLAQTNLVLSRKNAGLAVSGSYQYNRTSTDGYRFGNQWSGQALVFKQFPLGGPFSLTPFGGVSAEKVERDETLDGKYAASTGGNGWFASAGINLKYDKWLVGMAFSQPFSQHYSNAEVKANGRLTAQLTYIF